MTQQEMNQFIRVENAISYNSVEVKHNNGHIEVGYFLGEIEDFNSENKWRFVTNNNSSSYRTNPSNKLTIVINGDDVSKLELL